MAQSPPNTRLIAALALVAAGTAGYAQAQTSAASGPLPPSVRIAEPPDCPAYHIKPGTPVSTSKQTRAAVLAYIDAGKRHDVEAMNKTMAPDATLWYAGTGCADRTKFVSSHNFPHPPSTFVRVQPQSLIVEGDKAALLMITEQAWPGGGSLKFHSIHMLVSLGKIVSLRQYSVDALPLTQDSPLGRAKAG